MTTVHYSMNIYMHIYIYTVCMYVNPLLAIV